CTLSQEPIRGPYGPRSRSLAEARSLSTSADAAIAEGVGLRQRHQEILETIARGGELRRQRLEPALILGRLQAAVGRVAAAGDHALLHEHALRQLVAEVGGTDDRAGDIGVLDLARVVDRLPALGGAEEARAVELLEAEADRIHQAVARVARRIGVVLR